MPKIKHEDCIIETIIKLRTRKARPDVERICHLVQRKHGLSFDDTQADLQRLVNAGIVVKVDYKGSISYRIASKKKQSSMPESTCKANIDSVRVLIAMRDLTQRNVSTAVGTSTKTSQGQAIRLCDIEEWLVAEDGHTVDNVEALLQGHVDEGKMELNSDGLYILCPVKNWKKSFSKGGAGVRKIGSATVTSTATLESDELAPCGDAEAEPLAEVETGLTVMTGSSTVSNNAADDCQSTTYKHSPKRGRPPTKRKKVCRRSQPSEFDPPPEGGSTGGKQARRESTEEPAGEGGRTAETPPPPPPSAVAMDDEPRCDFCLRTAAANKLGEPEGLLACKDCKAKAHPTCMGYSEDLARRAKTSPWQCIDCKTCYYCDDSGDADEMLFCDACDKGYHMNCHKPPVTEKPTGNWMCHECVLTLGLEADGLTSDLANNAQPPPSEPNGDAYNADVGGGSCLPIPNASPVPPQEAEGYRVTAGSASSTTGNSKVATPLPQLSLTIPTVVPDASDWTIDDVADFFCRVGFPDQADMFREQEIDGKSLLLMKRADVLTGLCLRLGPALKIYAHVQRLQTGGNPLY